MNFNTHSNLRNQHAFLSPSNFYWINDDEEKLITRWTNSKATELGTKLHAYAEDSIRLRRRQLKNKDSVNMFINDAIGYRMEAEQTLYYSENCFGTADAICMHENEKILRIHDLKTGEIPGHMEQLMIYAALFFLEYREWKPMYLKTELRIYQFGEIQKYIPNETELEQYMDKIRRADEIIRKQAVLAV